MAITYGLGANPFWFFVDKTGAPLAGGYMFSYTNSTRTTKKLIYQDPQGQFPYSDPIIFDGTGTSNALYFKVDSDNPDDTYYLEIYDQDSVLIRTIDNYSPAEGSGGGGNVNVNLRNYITNGQFWRNSGGISTVGVSLPLLMKIAPSAHDGFTHGNAQQYTGSDIVFQKQSTNSIDTLTFGTFTSSSLPGGVTPQNYVNYTCTVAGAEDFKFIQFPINRYVKANLNNQNITFTFFARCNTGNTALQVVARNFFGDGAGADPDNIQVLMNATLTNLWVAYSATISLTDVSSANLGPCGNDALFIQFNLPTNAITSIDIAIPGLFLGNIAPSEYWETYDQLNAVFSAPRTGFTKIGIGSDTDTFGYVLMDDGTLGNSSSNAITRANADTFPLYNLIWNKILNVAGPSYVPIYNSDGSAGTKGATAVDDFTANKQLSLPKNLGRVIAGCLPAQVAKTFTTAFATNSQLTLSSTVSFNTGAPVVLSVTAPDTLPAPLVAGTVYYAIRIDLTHIELAASPTDAIAGTFITLTSNGTGTSQTVTVSPDLLGEFLGERTHIQTAAEVGSHTHPASLDNTRLFAAGSSGSGDFVQNIGGSSLPVTVGFNSGGSPMNWFQPTTFLNVYMKL